MRERGTIVSWGGAGTGRIEAESGERLTFFYWTVLRGFDQLGSVSRSSSRVVSA
jgi:hypothetical protein